MALTRGVTALYPCPRCLISREDLGDLTVKGNLRTTENMMETLVEARGKKLAADKEKTLRSKGLRDVEVGLQFFI